MIEQYANDASTTLASDITDSDTTLTVTDASAFPTQGQFRILIDSELILVTAVGSDVFTIIRGVEGTTAALHVATAPITQVLTVSGLQAIATNPIGISGQQMFLSVNFEQSSQNAFILVSSDAKNWSLVKVDSVYLPSGGVRDPSIFFDGTTYWMAYTRVSSPFYKWGLASSPDLITWTHVLDVDESGIGSTAYAWAPEWFVDDDGSVHIIVALGSTTSNMQLYETHPTATDYSTWSTATAITGSSLPSDMIDGYCLKVSGTYYMFYKNDSNKYVEVMTSASLTSGYTVQGSGHWLSNWPATSGDGWEGISIVQIDESTWIMCVDSVDVSDNGLGYQYSIYSGSPGSGWLTGGNWSSLTPSVDPFIKRHGTVIRIQDFITARNALAGHIGNNRSPCAVVTGSCSIPTVTSTPLSFQTIAVDNLPYFDGTSKFTVQTTGLYHVSYYCHWATNSATLKIAEICINGTNFVNGTSQEDTALDSRFQCQGLFWLNAGDYVQCIVYQNTGASLTVGYCSGSIARVGG